MVDTMSLPYAHMSHPYFWGILIYSHSQTCTHAFLSYLRGIRAYIHSKPLHQYDSNNTTNSFNVILRSRIHTWHSGHLGNSCNTHSKFMPSHGMQYKLVEYHYTYVPHPIPGNIDIPIRLAPTICNQIIHHNTMHAICFVSCFLACRL
jgi:hypothetical protein